MSRQYPIIFVENATEEDHSVLFKGINEFAAASGFNAAAGSYFFAVYDDAGKIVAAISGYDNFGKVEIGGLWVQEVFRHQGYGEALVQKALEWGQKHGCTFCTVFTLKEWPAYTFYRKQGFQVEFERAGHANGATGCYLSKKLEH